MRKQPAKSSPQKKPATSAGSPQRAKLIEEFAALDEEVANYRPRIRRHERLRELILSWYPKLEPEEEQRVPGKTCDIIITSRDLIRSVSPAGKQALFKLWGPRDFIAKSILFLKSLPDPSDKRGLYTVQAASGPRHLKVVDKVQAAHTSAA